MYSSAEEKKSINLILERSASERAFGADWKLAKYFLDNLFGLLFDGLYTSRRIGNPEDIARGLNWLRAGMQRRVGGQVLPPKPGCPTQMGEAIDLFFDQLPRLYDTLWLDARTAFESDPAAESMHEVVGAYPGFFGIAVHRIAHFFFGLGVPVFPRVLSEFAHRRTGIDIHPGARIGSAFFMDHGTGIVIGGTTDIRDNVKVYQGVTLGALSVSKDLAGSKRHPTIEDNVVIYAGATILGGDTVIGRNSVIGGNAWITESVPAHSVVYHKNEVRVRAAREDHQIEFNI